MGGRGQIGKVFSLYDWKQIGRRLYDLRDGLISEYLTYKKNSLPAKYLDRAIKAIDKARDALDEYMFTQYPDHDELGRIFYPGPQEQKDTALRELLAELEHNQWAHWTRYMLGNLSPENIERWRRQIETPYAELSEKEKDSDRGWADRVLGLCEIQTLKEEAEKWVKLVPLLTEGDEEEAIEIYMARAKTAFMTETLGRCLVRRNRLRAIEAWGLAHISRTTGWEPGQLFWEILEGKTVSEEQL